MPCSAPVLLTTSHPQLFLHPLLGPHHHLLNEMKVMPAEHLHQHMSVFVSVHLQLLASVPAVTVIPCFGRTRPENTLHFLIVSTERDIIQPFNTLQI